MRFPETWREMNVGSVILDLQPGFAQKPGEEDEGTTPQIRTHNVTPDGKISLDGIKHISASVKEAVRYTLVAGDVVFNNTNSEEWVGKTAVFDQEGEYVFSNHMTRLRAHPELVLPEYLAAYLHLLWAMGYSKTRAKRWVSQAGIESSALASFKLPLPTLPEQQRIVDVLRLAEAVAKEKRSVSDKIDDLVRTAYWQHFGDWYTSDGLRDPVRISDCVADSQYGVSEAMEQSGAYAVLRMNSITTSGWLNLSDLKYADLSKRDIDATELRNGDLLFNRTNSKELVGKCAIWRDAKGSFSFASYLVRLRLKECMLPEYLWATLNSAYGKYRLMNSAKQAVSMANVSPTDLGRITVPLPPVDLQEKFAHWVKNIEALRTEMLSKLDAFSELHNLVTQQALLGDLTLTWRNEHAEQIESAAKNRDALLRERGTRIIQVTSVAEPIKSRIAEGHRPARHWLLGELSEFQRQVLVAFTAYPAQPLLVEDPEMFAHFCDAAEVQQYLAPFGSKLDNRIRRTLSQLAALGLIAKITVPKNSLGTGERDFLKAFRPLRPDELIRLVDIAALGKTLSTNEELQHFTVVLDFESSEHAGAGGMFQVVELRDDNDKICTELVDQGKHYAAFDELAVDIARRLGVPVGRIVLEE
ncbi:MAG: restriction endonuclease subunit S [Pseudomonadota bacterium]